MSQNRIKRIGILTSGGDAQGMNPAIRAIVRSANQQGIEVIAFYNGFKGIIEMNFETLTNQDVSGLSERGGTILGTMRYPEFKNTETQKEAAIILKNLKIDALIVLGGDGSMQGANKIKQFYDISIIGIPCTIDNDIFGTNYTLGYDTALNQARNFISSIKDTASSHSRVFIVEIMGNGAGLLTVEAAIAVGAEGAITEKINKNALEKILHNASRKTKKSLILLVMEGEETGGARGIQKLIQENWGKLYDTRTSRPQHFLRGGSPSAKDAIIATQMGIKAIEMCLNNISGMIGVIEKGLAVVDIETLKKREIDLTESFKILEATAG